MKFYRKCKIDYPYKDNLFKKGDVIRIITKDGIILNIKGGKKYLISLYLISVRIRKGRLVSNRNNNEVEFPVVFSVNSPRYFEELSKKELDKVLIDEI